MSVSVQEKAGSRVFEVHVSGKLGTEDYATWVPRIESMIRQYGKIRILFDMHEFHGWSGGALWEDIKFDIKHFADIERIAMVGESRWQHGMAAFCRPFTSAKVRYFPREEEEAARRWLDEDLGTGPSSPTKEDP
jgi:hypothetical protein